MKKYLYLLRHAKSSWNYPELNDFERPLNKRGRHDAPLMAVAIKKSGLVPDLIVSSPASRAAMTARIVAEVLKLDERQIVFDHMLYDATASVLMDIVKRTGDTVEKLLLVGHNPGLTTLANLITGHHIENIPTAGLCGIELPAGQWQGINGNCGTFLFLKTPKAPQGASGL